MTDSINHSHPLCVKNVTRVPPPTLCVSDTALGAKIPTVIVCCMTIVLRAC